MLGCVVFEMVFLELVFLLWLGGNIFEILNNIVYGVLFIIFDEVDKNRFDIGDLICFCLMFDLWLRLLIEDLLFFCVWLVM